MAEEKVIFGLNAKAMSQLTLAKIRKVYSKSDNKAIAKQLGMSSHENATPIRILHNSAGHLSGPARCLGGTVVGYLGVRVFCPRPAAIMVIKFSIKYSLCIYYEKYPYLFNFVILDRHCRRLFSAVGSDCDGSRCREFICWRKSLSLCS